MKGSMAAVMRSAGRSVAFRSPRSVTRQAGGGFEKFAGARDRTRIEVISADCHLACESRRGPGPFANIRRARGGPLGYGRLYWRGSCAG